MHLTTDSQLTFMRAVILAGGFAKRMWPTTHDFPKPLLPISGRPAIDYIIDRLQEIRIEKTFVSTNLKFEKLFQTWLASKPHDRIEVIVERSRSEGEKLGAIRALAELARQLPVDDYIILAGDNIFSDSLEAMVRFYGRVRRPVVAIFDAEDSNQIRRGSSVSLARDMTIVSFEEKPTRPTGRIIGACIYILPYPTLLRTGEYLSEGGGGDEPGNFIAWLCKKETVYGFKLRERVWDMGSMEEYERTQREFPRRCQDRPKR
jgi:glucose-1-phosphate thymidylyltransferase